MRDLKRVKISKAEREATPFPIRCERNWGAQNDAYDLIMTDVHIEFMNLYVRGELLQFLDRKPYLRSTFLKVKKKIEENQLNGDR